MMASREASASRQRMANHCFFVEDPSKTAKLACSSQSRPQHSTNGSSAEQKRPSASKFALYDSSEASSDTQLLWTGFEPNSAYLKESLNEQLNAGEGIEGKANQNPDPSQCNSYTISGSNYGFDTDWSINSFVLPPPVVLSFTEKEGSTEVEESKSWESSFQQTQKCRTVVEEQCYEDEFMDWTAIEKPTSMKRVEDYFELEPQWKGGKKSDPWWQIADKDELALLVARDSACRLKNCDLSHSLDLHAGKGAFEKSNQNKISSENCKQNAHSTMCKQPEFMARTLTTDEPYQASDRVKLPANFKCQLETVDSSEVDLKKAQLLQALCHSQTRARKAELAAQKAHNEKEHIIKLFFRQASHLFAYKQWLQLLQLESLCLQMKIREQHIYTLLPDLPWISFKRPEVNGATRDEVGGKGKKNRRKKCTACRYIFAFAVGFGLASAGLLLGLTLRWLPMAL